MNNREIDIVVALSPDGAFRLDLADGALLASRQTGGAAANSAADSVAAALRLSRVRRSARVLVLSADFFSQTIRLPRRQMAGLSGAEIETALAYEIEPFSNIPMDAGVAAFRPLSEESGDTASWRAVQLARADWDAISSAVHAAGGRLAGCAPLDPLPASDDEIAAALMQVAADAASPQSRIPVAAPATSSKDQGGLPRTAIISFILVALACAIHFGIATRMRAGLRSDAAVRESLAAENNRIAAEIRGIEARRAEIARAAAELQAAKDSLLVCRKAWSSLLRDLPAACGEDVMVVSITGDISSGGVGVEAIATDADAPAACMVRLAGLASESGWKLTPREVRGGSRGPVTFRFALDFTGARREGGAR